MRNILVDTAEIEVAAGKGGDGLVSFRREKHVPKGGPDGGNGGDGGDVYLEVAQNMATLLDFRAKTKYKAEDGERGKKRNLKGSSGADLIIKVPLGTLVYEGVGKDKLLIGDLAHPAQQLRVVKGGTGGRGNNSFKSSVNQVPRQNTPGKKGGRKKLSLEVKLIADIGLVGLPNAGKSTLINKLTDANARVASYPFTTIIPNLGVWRLEEDTLIVADIPGLIEGASVGKGLGDDFLRHVERTRFLIHVVDPYQNVTDPQDIPKNCLQNYKVIRKELENYGANLKDKKEIVVINKIDITEVSEHFEDIQSTFKKEGLGVLGISAVTGKGIDKLGWKVKEVLPEVPKIVEFSEEKPTKVYTISDLQNKRLVFRR
jgi:GTPase